MFSLVEKIYGNPLQPVPLLCWKVWLSHSTNSSFTTCLLLFSGLFGCCKSLLSSGCSDYEPGSTLISIQVLKGKTKLFTYISVSLSPVVGVLLVWDRFGLYFKTGFIFPIIFLFKKVEWGTYYVQTLHSWSASGKMPFSIMC